MAYRTNEEILLERIAIAQENVETSTGSGGSAVKIGRYDSGGRDALSDEASSQIAVTASGHVIVNDGGGALTVDGTVTANLSATDNAVLDTIDAVLDTIKVDTEAIETAVEAVEVTQNKMIAPTSTVMLNGTKAFTGPFYALTALEDTVIDASEGDTNITESDDSGSIQDLSGTLTIPKGVTIYGNFAVIELDSGKMIGYAGAGVTVSVAGS